MSRRKRTSKRRWLRRCSLGRLIPALAIEEHQLRRRFVFAPARRVNQDVHHAVAKR